MQIFYNKICVVISFYELISFVEKVVMYIFESLYGFVCQMFLIFGNVKFNGRKGVVCYRIKKYQFCVMFVLCFFYMNGFFVQVLRVSYNLI